MGVKVVNNNHDLLGDRVAQTLKPVAQRLGLENCGGCQRRQQMLNKVHQSVRAGVRKIWQ